MSRMRSLQPAQGSSIPDSLPALRPSAISSRLLLLFAELPVLWSLCLGWPHGPPPPGVLFPPPGALSPSFSVFRAPPVAFSAPAAALRAPALPSEMTKPLPYTSPSPVTVFLLPKDSRSAHIFQEGHLSMVAVPSLGHMVSLLNTEPPQSHGHLSILVRPITYPGPCTDCSGPQPQAPPWLCS